jgi:hypothetical protein
MNQSQKDQQERTLRETQARQAEAARRAEIINTNISALTLADLDRMTTDETRVFMNNPTFITRANELYATAKPKPRKA